MLPPKKSNSFYVIRKNAEIFSSVLPRLENAQHKCSANMSGLDDYFKPDNDKVINVGDICIFNKHFNTFKTCTSIN